MIDCVKKNECTGCGACVNICSLNCIELISDENGFYIPMVNMDECIKCGMCLDVCPILRKPENNNKYEKPVIYAAWTLDESIRLSSTSGGIFSELAKRVLLDGGYVCAARYNDEFLVEHYMIDNTDNIKLLRQSKYVQSYIGFTFREIKYQLDGKKTVAFCGSPCQVAGLKNFLGIDYENLYTFDFVCRGMNSPKAYKSYLEMLKKKYKSEIKKVWFKNKTYGWNNFSTHVEFENGKTYLKTRNKDLFMRGYLRYNFYMRSCCFDCKFKSVTREGDITLADFWGVSRKYPNLDEDKGTSLIFINSDKGKRLFGAVKDDIFRKECNIEDAVIGNKCILESVKDVGNRESFLKSLDSLRFDKCYRRYAKNEFKYYIKNKIKMIKKILVRIKNR